MLRSNDILIIEDDAAIASLMMEVLQEDGYHVRSAPNGEQGLHEIAIARPALVLLDLHMPGITAADFFAYLYAHDLSTLPVVIVTADVCGPKYISIPREIRFLFKPFDLDDLITCVTQCVAYAEDVPSLVPMRKTLTPALRATPLPRAGEGPGVRAELSG